MNMITETQSASIVPNPTTVSRPDIEHWWAAEAMIASYNHVYRLTYKTRYEVHGPVAVSVYDGTPIASFQYEFLALSADARFVVDTVRAYPVPVDKQYTLDVFHHEPSNPELKQKYTCFGYEFIRTGPILGIDLPPKLPAAPRHIHKATTLKQAEIANHTLTTEGERIYAETLLDKHIHSFYAQVDGEAAGWAQMVTVYPGVAYIHQLYILEPYRRRKFGTALIRYAQREALKLGLKKLVLIPSDMAIPLYRRLGYRPLLYFSVFRPQSI